SSLEPEPLPPDLRPDLMPKHVAVIMDGNRRWAEMRGLPASAGHEAGVQSMRRTIDQCCSWGIKVLTLLWFSSDNWNRPKRKLQLYPSFPFSLCSMSLSKIGPKKISTVLKHIKISVIGDTLKLPTSLQRMISNAEEKTKQNCGMQLMAAISYSGKYDVMQACKTIAGKVKDGIMEVEDINEGLIEQELEASCTKFPNPDLMIRTSGELRVSNFLLWQLAYTELGFDAHLWPDFGKDQFVEALSLFQQRHRRFGGRRH
ncbi:dehydrodolichyl diphosphate synthase 2-like, partial [Neltuma alba]|uniref:dehydrodolichyl diphosphate synthase 2-like n=1 Tax=Neltuma alba TaxID=207710 RepID=UPI0010A42ED8